MDTGPLDTGLPDVGPPDVGPPDVGLRDAGPPDVGVDAAMCYRRADCDSTPASCETALATTTNCRMCGERCMAPLNATATCDFEDGCDWACNSNFENCDTLDGNGCEINTNTDVMHCGDCTTVCSAFGVNVRTACTGGDCIPSCQSGFADCNGDLITGGAASDGCEQGLTTLTNCGSCGMGCGFASAEHASFSCGTGMCRMTCTIGFSNCDGNASNGCEAVGAACP